MSTNPNDRKISELPQGSPELNDPIVFVDLTDNITKQGTKQDLQGNPGQAATVNVGSTTTGVPGTDAIVTNSGTENAAVLNFVIPRGDTGATGQDGQDGQDGQAATVNVGSTTTGVPGTDAIVTNSGTENAAVLNFVIPRGEEGEDGRGIVSVIRTSGDGSSGTTDTYTITYTDNTTSTFQVYNGADGSAGNVGTLQQVTDEGSTTTNAITTGGLTVDTNTLHVDTLNNRVGIGTTSPQSNLHVSSTGDTILRVTSADGNGSFLDLGDSSDPDGGRIVYDSGNNLTFSTNSSERLRIDSSGNVGIGTNNPSRQFQVRNTSSTAVIAITSSGSGSSQLQMGDTSDNDIGSINYNNGNNSMAFVTNNAERLRINSSGGVGIGTTNPLHKVDISGNEDTAYDPTSDSGQSNHDATLQIFNQNTTDDSFASLVFRNRNSGVGISRITSVSRGSGTTDMSFVTENNNTKSEKLRITSGGNVGIGTSSPGSKLQVDGNDVVAKFNSSFNYGLIDLQETVGNKQIRLGIESAGGIIGTTSSDPLTIRTGNATRMYLDTSGNVGIGTSSPGSKLQVNAEQDAGCIRAFVHASTTTGNNQYGYFSKHSAAPNNDWYFGQKSDNNFYFATEFGSGPVDRLTISNNGNVGIGTTSPLHKLHVTGGWIAGGNTTNPWTISSNGSDMFLNTGVNNSEIIFRPNGDGSDVGQVVITTAMTTFGAGIRAASLPTSATGLSSGDIWRDGTDLKIVA